MMAEQDEARAARLAKLGSIAPPLPPIRVLGGDGARLNKGASGAVGRQVGGQASAILARRRQRLANQRAGEPK